MIETLPLFALAAPFIIWPIETFLPYPYIVEELFKLFFVFNINKEEKHFEFKIKFTVLVCALFGVSESIFYLFDIFISGSILDFIERLLITVPMHIITGLVMILGINKGKIGLVIGFISAVCIHFIFNLLIAKVYFL
jgi:hypothetical protein